MKYLFLITFCWFCSSSFATACHQYFFETEIVNSVKSGTSIYYPFQFASLINGEYEPELQKEVLQAKSKEKVINLVDHLYRVAVDYGASRSVDDPSDTQKTITYHGPNSGFYVSVSFSLVKGCWLMSGLSNQST